MKIVITITNVQQKQSTQLDVLMMIPKTKLLEKNVFITTTELQYNMKKQLAKLLKAYHKKWDCFGNKRRKK